MLIPSSIPTLSPVAHFSHRGCSPCTDGEWRVARDFPQAGVDTKGHESKKSHKALKGDQVHAREGGGKKQEAGNDSFSWDWRCSSPLAVLLWRLVPASKRLEAETKNRDLDTSLKAHPPSSVGMASGCSLGEHAEWKPLLMSNHQTVWNNQSRETFETLHSVTLGQRSQQAEAKRSLQPHLSQRQLWTP